MKSFLFNQSSGAWICIATIGAMMAFNAGSASTGIDDSLLERVKGLEQREYYYEPVGSISASMLPYAKADAQFKKLYLLADGRAATNTKYASIVGPKLPDLRGVFLRGLNNIGGTGKTNWKTHGDPQNRTVAGVYQVDAFKSHTHLYIDKYNPWPGSKKGTPRFKYFDPGGGPTLDHIVQRESKPTGGLETRPRNVTVYYYVRVN